MVEVGGSNPPGPTKHKRARLKRAFLCLVVLPRYRTREASRKTRLKARLVRQSKAEAPAGFNRQRQWRLKTSRPDLLTGYMQLKH
jgi:hypothetical protein